MIDTEKLLNSLDIRHVIEAYTGNRIRHNKTLCPFHNDHQASLSVKTEKGIWRCWVCDKSGNAINFTRQFYGLSFIDACKKLSEDFKVDDIGLWNDGTTNRDIWGEVENECRQKRQQELQQVREDIDGEIEAMTIIHRAMLKAGVPDEVLNRYAEEIDSLEKRKEVWR